jgi:hypothetical protein
VTQPQVKPPVVLVHVPMGPSVHVSVPAVHSSMSSQELSVGSSA